MNNIQLPPPGILVDVLYDEFGDPRHNITHLNSRKMTKRVTILRDALNNILTHKTARWGKIKAIQELRKCKTVDYNDAGITADIDALTAICNRELNNACSRPRRTRSRTRIRTGDHPGPAEVIPPPNVRPPVQTPPRRRPTPIVESPAPLPNRRLTPLDVLNKRPVVRKLLDMIACTSKMRTAIAGRRDSEEDSIVLSQKYTILTNAKTRYVAFYEAPVIEKRDPPTIRDQTKTRLREGLRDGSVEVVYGTRKEIGWVKLKERGVRPNDDDLWETLQETFQTLLELSRKWGAPVMGSDSCAKITSLVRHQRQRNAPPAQMATPSRTSPLHMPVLREMYPAARLPERVTNMGLRQDPFFNRRTGGMFYGKFKTTLIEGVGDDRARLRALIRLFHAN